jgi:hypothetical protein
MKQTNYSYPDNVLEEHFNTYRGYFNTLQKTESRYFLTINDLV